MNQLVSTVQYRGEDVSIFGDTTPPEFGLRALLGSHIGAVLTPELCAAIELLSKRPSFSDRLMALQKAGEKYPPVSCPVRHHFAPGVCIREMSIPANTLVVGATHLLENMVIVSKGKILAATPDGTIEVSAGQTLRCKPGTKNAVLTLEDSTWSNVFPNPDDTQDVDAVLLRAYGMTSEDLLGGINNAQFKNWIAQEKLMEVTS